MRLQRKFHIALILSWSIIIGLQTVMSLRKAQEVTSNIAKLEARANFNKDRAMSSWVASHGGVYVVVDSITQPNPALSHVEGRDIIIPSGKKLTLMNATYVVKELNERFSKYHGISGDITSKNPIRSENKPDEWELNALNQFENGIKEVSGYSEINNEPYWRLMQPMITERACLKCHVHQGYKVGDVLGGVGVSIPTKPLLEQAFYPMKRSMLTNVLIVWLIGLGGLLIGGNILDKSFKKQNQIGKKLELQNKKFALLNEKLDKKVEQKTKELLIAKEKAEESDRLKSAFLANMSHEIRTPMNGILGFTSLLKEPDLDGDEQQQYISIIEKNGAGLLKTINDILDTSRIEAGQVDISYSEINIKEQMEELYLFFKPEAEKKEIQLTLKNGIPAKESIIKSDKVKINSVLINLIKNAIKYTNKGNIDIGYCKKENELEFFVVDSGVGISKNRQEAIFDRFNRVNNEDKHAIEGSGLGLFISKSYVEMLRGRIWVEGDEGIGSRFYFSIPCNPE